jgi:uncharacterized CHY-type Zn-finger protein
MATRRTDDRRTTTAPATDDRFAVPLRGVTVDPETRCETYYPCAACHDAATDHEAAPWPRDRFDEPAVLCGVCGATLSAREYLDGEEEAQRASGSEGQSPSGNRASLGDSRAKTDDACPRCDAAFNPGCRAHRDRYFEA